MKDLARRMWPGHFRSIVESDRAACRVRVRSQLGELARHVNGGGDPLDDAVIVEATDHRHGAARHL